MAIEVADVSSWQGTINFAKVKAAGIDAVILRCGFTGYRTSLPTIADAMFEKNYAGAVANGLKVGVYYYSCATDTKKAQEEADFVLTMIRGKKLDFPVYFDTEDNHNTLESGVNPQNQITIGADRLTAVAKVFCGAIRSAGYTAGIYSYLFWLENYIHMDQLAEYETWVAQYYSKCQYEGPYQMWQYTSTGSVSGISGNVDRSHCYKDYGSVVPETAGLVQYPMQRNAILSGFDWLTEDNEKLFQYGISISNTQTVSHDVFAAHTGTVVAAGFDPQDGNRVVVLGELNSRADLLTRYCHLASIKTAVGAGVLRGQIIGVQGATGQTAYQRLLFETWLVPKNYTYRLEDRPAYAVDPVSLCRVLPGQVFPFVDDQSHHYSAIPYPEPVPDAPVSLIQTVAVPVAEGPGFQIAPGENLSPVISGLNREKRFLGQYCEAPQFPALQRGIVDGKPWVQIETCLGVYWVPLDEERVRLVSVEPPDQTCEERLRRCQEAIEQVKHIICSPP